MHGEFISKENLKQVLTDVQHFFAQHKTLKQSPTATVEQSNKLNKQQQQRLKQKLTHLHVADIAQILEGLPLENRLDALCVNLIPYNHQMG